MIASAATTRWLPGLLLPCITVLLSSCAASVTPSATPARGEESADTTEAPAAALAPKGRLTDVRVATSTRQSGSEPRPSMTPTSSATPWPTVDPSRTKRFDDPMLGLSFEYPTDLGDPIVQIAAGTGASTFRITFSDRWDAPTLGGVSPGAYLDRGRLPWDTIGYNVDADGRYFLLGPNDASGRGDEIEVLRTFDLGDRDALEYRMSPLTAFSGDDVEPEGIVVNLDGEQFPGMAISPIGGGALSDDLLVDWLRSFEFYEPTVPQPTPRPTREPTPTPIAPAVDAREVEASELPKPAGSVLVWADELGLSVHDEKGRRSRLLEAAGLRDPLISSDGRLVAYQRSVDLEARLRPDKHLTAYELGMVSRLRGNGNDEVVALGSLPTDDLPGTVQGARWPTHIAWLPGESRLAFSTLAQPDEPCAYCVYAAQDYWQVDPWSGRVARLLEDGEGGRFEISPDGRHVALVRRGPADERPQDLVIADVDGRNARWKLGFASPATGSSFRFTPRPYWRADGSSLLIAIPGTEPHAEAGFFGEAPTELFDVPVEAAPRSLGALTLDWGMWSGRLQWRPDWGLWDPTRSRLLWAEPMPPDREALPALLRSARWDREQPVDLGPVDRTRLLGWSPDGTRFLLKDNPHVYVGGLDEPLRALLPADRVHSTRWLDRETFVVQHTADETGTEIRLWAVDGRNRRLAWGAGSLSFDVHVPSE